MVLIILTNDYFPWDKEYREYLEKEAAICNSIFLLMQCNTMSAEDARTALQARIIEADKEYLVLKEEYLEQHK